MACRWAEPDGNSSSSKCSPCRPLACAMTAPVRGDVPKTQNIPWTADIQLIDSVKQRMSNLGITKRQQKDIGDEMLRLWLEANRMSANENSDHQVN